VQATVVSPIGSVAPLAGEHVAATSPDAMSVAGRVVRDRRAARTGRVHHE
jgi:hypothetical protein